MTNRKYNGGSALSALKYRNSINVAQVQLNQTGGESSPASVPAPSPTTVALQGGNNTIPVYASDGSPDQRTIMQIKNTQNQSEAYSKTDTPGPGLKGGKKRKRTKGKQTKKRRTRRNKKSRKSRSSRK